MFKTLESLRALLPQHKDEICLSVTVWKLKKQ
nr:MAG TPA: hypothetical protein [Caudoviricetes sp.]DAT93775.1 MAG TPA: hypothetical protein [Caudoviricetes sp.]DAV01877.1 MAG TPA: hypothetical protein [Caudoviricetes sp.]